MKGKQPFHEAFVSPKTDALHSPAVDFDYDSVERGLGQQDRDDDAALVFIRKVFEFCTASVKGSPRNTPRMAGKKLIALAWVVNPGTFEGTPSATQLAKRIGVTRTAFLKLTGEASREFGIRNRAQAHYKALGRTDGKTPSTAKPDEKTPQIESYAQQTGNADGRRPPVKESFSKAPKKGGE